MQPYANPRRFWEDPIDGKGPRNRNRRRLRALKKSARQLAKK